MIARFTLGLLLLSAPAWAAIAFDAQSTAEGTTDATAAHTFSGSANFAYICVGVRDSGGAVAAPTGVTVDGNAATLVANALNPNDVVLASVWRYNNPPTGTVNVIATGAAGTDFTLIAVRSYSGVYAAGPVGTPVEFEPLGETTNIDANAIGSETGQLGLLCAVARKGTSNITFSADATAPVSTERADFTHSSGSAQISLAVYDEDGASSSIDMRINGSESVATAAVGVSLIPDPAGATRRRGAVALP